MGINIGNGYGMSDSDKTILINTLLNLEIVQKIGGYLNDLGHPQLARRPVGIRF